MQWAYKWREGEEGKDGQIDGEEKGQGLEVEGTICGVAKTVLWWYQAENEWDTNWFKWFSRNNLWQLYHITVFWKYPAPITTSNTF